jgi:hypothetical protein
MFTVPDVFVAVAFVLVNTVDTVAVRSVLTVGVPPPPLNTAVEVDETDQVIFPAIVFPEATTPLMNDEPAAEPSAVFPTDASDANAEPDGAEVIFAVIVKVSSVLALNGAVIVTGILLVTPGAKVGIVPTVTAVGTSVTPADAGATEVTTPRPKAATATSATRLKVVFVDNCFLSISRSEEFPPLGFG